MGCHRPWEHTHLSQKNGYLINNNTKAYMWKYTKPFQDKKTQTTKSFYLYYLTCKKTWTESLLALSSCCALSTDYKRKKDTKKLLALFLPSKQRNMHNTWNVLVNVWAASAKSSALERGLHACWRFFWHIWSSNLQTFIAYMYNIWLQAPWHNVQ
jgi:hypothetical protein